jgi:SNF2 family DNA or RNA helicase
LWQDIDGDDDTPLEQRDTSSNRMRVLAAITRLRLAACHPAFALGDGGVDGLAASTKQHACLAAIDDIVACGQSVLVFSQFLSHLRLIEKLLLQRNIATVWLSGETPPDVRAARVAAFQAGTGPSVFLLSMKAGGVGLTLTRASYVVHLDPWWNPAVEDQATDRAHRIGQTEPVTVVRLIAKDTIEEKMLLLQEQKRSLVEAVLDGTDQGARLSFSDLLDLVRVVPGSSLEKRRE